MHPQVLQRKEIAPPPPPPQQVPVLLLLHLSPFDVADLLGEGGGGGAADEVDFSAFPFFSSRAISRPISEAKSDYFSVREFPDGPTVVLVSGLRSHLGKVFSPPSLLCFSQHFFLLNVKSGLGCCIVNSEERRMTR